MFGYGCLQTIIVTRQQGLIHSVLTRALLEAKGAVQAALFRTRAQILIWCITLANLTGTIFEERAAV